MKELEIVYGFFVIHIIQITFKLHPTFKKNLELCDNKENIYGNFREICTFEKEIYQSKPLTIFIEELSKAIMFRSKLRNQLLKTKTQDFRIKHNKQTNLYVSITRKAKRSYYENMDLKDITDSKKFRATVKPLFSNEIKSTECITLDENGKIISNDKELVVILNGHFEKHSL